jgi:hypothetical protein
MGLIDYLDKLITEHGSAAVLDKHLTLVREQAKALEKQVSDLQQENAGLRRRVAELQEVEKQLKDSLSAPFKVSDDYEFETEGGYWIERKSKLRVCAKCLLPPTKIASPLFEAVGSGFEEEFAMVWRCGHCGTDYFYKTRP